MEDKLIILFAQVLGVSPESLSDATGPEDTDEWDSLKAMELVSAIEEAFAVELTTAEIMKMRTIGIAREVIRGKGIDI